MKLTCSAASLCLTVIYAHGQSSSCIHNGFENDLLRLSIHSTSILGIGSPRNFEHALHHHDPAEEIDLQALELNLFSNLSRNTQLHSTYNISEDRSSLSGELEEFYVRLHNLSAGFELKGGRFIHNLGLQGNRHLHDWDFTNSDLVTASFLGEEGVLTDGAELSWYYVYDNYGVFGLTLAHGKVLEHGEDGEFSDSVTSIRSTLHHYTNDSHQHFFGLTAALGKNGFGRKSKVAGVDYTYSWTSSRNEIWNTSVDTSLQLMYRNVQSQDRAIKDSHDHFALALSSVYHFSEN